jgi:cellulose synthase/poly-beta-1,6-N-acetylglucosamine synthase-like glycosyltransferase
MDDAAEAVETGGFYLGLALTHVPMMVFIGYGALTLVERAMGSRRGKIRTRLPSEGELPFVCLQLPMYNEPACARRAIDAACAVRWPRNLIEVQVIDESNDGTEEVVDCGVRGLERTGRGVRGDSTEQGVEREGSTDQGGGVGVREDSDVGGFYRRGGCGRNVGGGLFGEDYSVFLRRRS